MQLLTVLIIISLFPLFFDDVACRVEGRGLQQLGSGAATEGNHH
jgi:hypothetical protein